MTLHPELHASFSGKVETDPAAPALVGIFGTGRNGSTLITRLLDGIPGAYVHPVEANFLSAMNDLAGREFVSENVIKNVVTHPLHHLDRSIPFERLRRFYANHQNEIETDLLPVVGDVELGRPPFEALADRPTWLARDFVVAFLRAFTDWVQPGAKPATMVFKTIETPYVADYERLFPSMRFIHIIRDPIEMWASQKRSLVIGKELPQWYLGMDNLSACIDRRWMPHARLVADRLNAPSHFIVRYEDLLRDAKAVMSRLTAWLGVSGGASPTVQTVLGGRHPQQLQRYSSQPGVETSREVVRDLKERHGYVDVVSERERRLIRLATWSMGRRLGYGLDSERPDPDEVRRLWRSVDEGEFGHGGGIRSSILDAWSFLKRRRYVRQVCREARV